VGWTAVRGVVVKGDEFGLWKTPGATSGGVGMYWT
jgi:hypothetical protein